jgi:hypothetical protein
VIAEATTSVVGMGSVLEDSAEGDMVGVAVGSSVAFGSGDHGKSTPNPSQLITSPESAQSITTK